MKRDKVVGDVLGDEHMLTPSDLFSKQFKRVRWGGYDPRDVDEFLERVADALESLIVNVRVLKDKNEEQRKAMLEFKELEGTLRNALVSTQRMGDDVVDHARREAQVLLEEARLKKSQAQLEAARIPAALTRDIHILEQQRARLRTEMFAILETHKKLIESLVPEDAVHVPTSFFEVSSTDQPLPRSGQPREQFARGAEAGRLQAPTKSPSSESAGGSKESISLVGENLSAAGARTSDGADDDSDES